METITGIVENIVYRNDDNGYTVADLDMEGELNTVVGSLPMIGEGERVKLGGTWSTHGTYGRQFKAQSCEKLPPDTKAGLLRYLSSGIIKGIGAVTAKKIIDHFGMDTLDIMRYAPERLTEVEGIGQTKAMVIAETLQEQMKLQEDMVFLQSLHISMNMAAKICNTYKEETRQIVEKQPYRLADEVEGMGFVRADRIARQLGYDADSPDRILAGIAYGLHDAARQDGHTCLPVQELVKRASSLLRCSEDLVTIALDQATIKRDVVRRERGGVDFVYLPHYDRAEREIASNIVILATHEVEQVYYDVNEAVEDLVRYKGIELSAEQQEAVKDALSGGVTVITGGPGTGKTTAINAIIYALERIGMEVTLAAPTGRAAKRMTEATGKEAKTIHRLLEYGYSSDDEILSFNRDGNNPLECDVLILDEMSMVDVILMQHLLRAVPIGCRIIMVGDVDQLPSVGPGNVLRDIMDSGCAKVAYLTTIFRQAQESLIVTNAHRINRGEEPELRSKDSDFFFISRNSDQKVIDALLEMAANRIPKKLGCDAVHDIQILSPVKKGALGVHNLNAKLQAIFNPEDITKCEKIFGEITFREGDKVMQIKNNYTLKWRKPLGNGAVQEGEGVFNGDVGYIKFINPAEKTLSVEFEDQRYGIYEFANIHELTLAYAVTIHKSQGSEFDVVIMPLLGGPPILMTRNLLYTAVTRAKRMVVIIGDENSVYRMSGNDTIIKRYSGLKQTIMEAL